eukprot:scaffold10264_cov33-Tisochrysis_lutea.AAC.2
MRQPCPEHGALSASSRQMHRRETAPNRGRAWRPRVSRARAWGRSAHGRRIQQAPHCCRHHFRLVAGHPSQCPLHPRQTKGPSPSPCHPPPPFVRPPPLAEGARLPAGCAARAVWP